MQLIADSGFVGLDAGRLRMAKELEAPGRMNRAGLIGIAQAKRLLNLLSDSIQNEPLASYAATNQCSLRKRAHLRIRSRDHPLDASRTKLKGEWIDNTAWNYFGLECFSSEPA